MAISSVVSAGDDVLASTFNNLRKDIFPYLLDSGSGIASGKYVYPDGDGTIGEASASLIATALTIGCSAEGAIGSGASGYIQDRGIATNVNWSFDVGFIGKLAYLGVDGYPTQNPPVDPGTIVRIVGIIRGTDKLYIITDSNYQGN